MSMAQLLKGVGTFSPKLPSMQKRYGSRLSINGLNDSFDNTVRYNILSTPNYRYSVGGADREIVNRTMSNGAVGFINEDTGMAVNTGGSPVYTDPVSGKLYVIRGQEMDNPSLYMLVASNNAAGSQPPTSEEPCPCANCSQELIKDYMYLSKVPETSNDKQYNVKYKTIVCDSTDASVTLACEEEIARLAQQGMSGLGRTMTDAEMDCNSKCRKVYQQNGDSFGDAAAKCAKICRGSMTDGMMTRTQPIQAYATVQRVHTMGALGNSVEAPIYETTSSSNVPQAEVYFLSSENSNAVTKGCTCKDSNMWLYILLAVLGAILAGFGAYYVFRKAK